MTVDFLNKEIIHIIIYFLALQVLKIEQTNENGLELNFCFLLKILSCLIHCSECSEFCLEIRKTKRKPLPKLNCRINQDMMQKYDMISVFKKNLNNRICFELFIVYNKSKGNLHKVSKRSLCKNVITICEQSPSDSFIQEHKNKQSVKLKNN